MNKLLVKNISLFTRKIDLIDFGVLCAIIDVSIRKNMSISIGYLNASSIVSLSDNEKLSEAFDQLNYTFPDGTGVYLAAKILAKEAELKRFNLTDHGYDLLSSIEEKAYSIFLLGSEQIVIESAVQNIERDYPALKLVGYESGYSDLDSNELIDRINSLNPDIVLVGLGTPRQELWIAKYKEVIQTNVLMSVGDLITYYAGKKIRGHGFIRKIGFEWLARAVFHPGKYLIRYARGIPVFMLLTINEYFKSIKKS